MDQIVHIRCLYLEADTDSLLSSFDQKLDFSPYW